MRDDFNDSSSVYLLAVRHSDTSGFSLPWMDGTYSGDIFDCTILTATSVGAADRTASIAWAIVESENGDAWRFFLSNLRTAILQIGCPSTTIMGGRDKCLRAADGEIPLATRSICLQHLSRNLQKPFGVAARNIFNSVVRFALTEENLRAAMGKLQEVSLKLSTICGV